MPKGDGDIVLTEPPAAEDRSDATRRLSDKILSAFTHAYAIGETVVAERLREVLVLNASRVAGRAASSGGGGGDGGDDPLIQADLWVRFIEARNRYKATCAAGAGIAEDALEAMKEAYRRWSMT